MYAEQPVRKSQSSSTTLIILIRIHGSSMRRTGLPVYGHASRFAWRWLSCPASKPVVSLRAETRNKLTNFELKAPSVKQCRSPANDDLANARRLYTIPAYRWAYRKVARLELLQYKKTFVLKNFIDNSLRSEYCSFCEDHFSVVLSLSTFYKHHRAWFSFA